MLPPALNPPTLQAPAQHGPGLKTDVQEIGSAPTYGSLIAATRDAVDRAVVASSRRQPTADAALPELFGTERFLRNAGNHLRLMMDLAGVRVDAIARLAWRINYRPIHEAPPGTWRDAAASLGAAHDLISTHLVDGAPRTPEATEKLLGPPAAAACRTITELILDSVTASDNLIHQSELAYQRGADHPSPSAHLRTFRATNRTLSILGRAAMWDLAGIDRVDGDVARSLDTAPLDDTLEVALPTDLTHTPPPAVTSSLAALRLLRQLLHDQARGLTSASPASLRDLALLGARLNDPDLIARSDATTPLARLNRAQAIDQVNAARSAWSTAATELTSTVLGTTKAPGAYAVAVHTLLEQPFDPRTQQALLTALPSIGRDAARTLEHLASRGELVTIQPIPLQTRKAWRPITVEHKDLLAERFTTAADASTRVTAALRDLHRSSTGSGLPDSSDTRQRALAQRQDLARGVTR